jgi:hypothetical protein
MKIVSNEKLIKRNSRIAQVTSLGGLAVLGYGMFISIKQPEQATFALVALIVGFILTQISMYFGSRFGRDPRPDQMLDQALKGVTNDHTIYHYTTPVQHLLVGPAGIWVLRPYMQRRGTITYEKNRWKLRGAGFAQAYLSIFGQEGLGRPDLEIESDIDTISRSLQKALPDQELPEIQGALVFCSDQIDIQAEDAPTPAVSLKKLKSLIRSAAKDGPLSKETLDAIKSVLPE